MTKTVNFAFFQRGLYPAAYEQVSRRLSASAFEWNGEATYWCESRNATIPQIDHLDWDAMPFVGDFSRRLGDGFHSSSNATPMPDSNSVKVACDGLLRNQIRPVLVTARGGDIDMGCLRIRDFFGAVGYSPDKLTAVSGGKDTSALIVLDWSEVECRANRVAMNERFRHLYNLNFKGLMIKVLEEGILRHRANGNSADRRSRQLRQTAFGPEFLQVLYHFRDVGPVPYAPTVRPLISIWQALVDGGWSWAKSAERVQNAKFALDFDDGVWFPDVDPLVTWTGTGSLPKLSEKSRSHFPTQVDRAISTACVLGLITHDYNVIEVSPFGHWLLDFLPSKAKDIDAPIRWNMICADDKDRGDNWLRDHFRRIKRAVNATRLDLPH
jgi:hypothetical protein